MDPQLENFFRSWLTPSLHLCGYRLKQPFCLGHALLLEAVESPFASAEPSARLTAADLILALRLCSQRWPFQPPGIRPSFRDRLFERWLSRHALRLSRAVETFLAWMRACTARPEYWRSSGGATGNPLTAPGHLARAAKLISRTGFSEERIWSMPYGLLCWYDGALDETQGAPLRFFYDSDLKEVAELPDLNELTEDQLFEQAQRDLGPEAAAAWQAQREAWRHDHGGRN